MNLEEQFGKILVKFDEFRCQKTFLETDIHIAHSKAYDYYATLHEGGHHGDRLAFANFVAGYLKAKIDAEQGNLL
jgi:hypothetical protein